MCRSRIRITFLKKSSSGDVDRDSLAQKWQSSGLCMLAIMYLDIAGEEGSRELTLYTYGGLGLDQPQEREFFRS